MSSSAQFRRTVQRDDRRRRLLADEALSDAPVVMPNGLRIREPSQHKSQHYGDAEFLDQQPRVMDLVPHRPWVLAAGFAAGVAVITALETACVYLCQPGTNSLGFAALVDFSRKDCLATWLAEMSLIATAVVSFLVYSIRRYRTDDYQGRYRVWIWAGAACLFLAADKSAGIHDAIRHTLTQLSGTTLMGDGALWWILPYLLVAGAIVARLYWDLRESWPALATLGLAATAYGVALVVRLAAVPDGPILRQAMIQQGAELSGHWLSLLAACIYLRHVIRDAEGLLPRREAKPTPTGVDKPAEKGENAASATVGKPAPAGASSTPVAASVPWRGVDPPHPTPPAPVQTRPVVATPPATSPTTAAAEDEESHAQHKMTKAEKKAMKERLMRERMQRQQQQSAKWK